MIRDFAPGDVIVREGVTVPDRRYVVQDPPRTSRGKLRLLPDGTKTILTTWWRHPSTGYQLPQHYRLARPD